MMEPSEIEDSNIFSPIKNKNKYILHFAEDTERKIKVLCETFSIELNVFIINTVGYFLYNIEDDIDSNKYDLTGSYYDVSKLIDDRSVVKNPPVKSEKKYPLEINFPQLILDAIRIYCDEIPLTVEEFIQDTLEWYVDDLVRKVKKGEFDFLEKFKDFSKVQESIQKITDSNLLKKLKTLNAKGES